MFVVFTGCVTLMLDIGAVELGKFGPACRTVVMIRRRAPPSVFLVLKCYPLETLGKIQAPLKPLGLGRWGPLFIPLLHRSITRLLPRYNQKKTNVWFWHAFPVTRCRGEEAD